jgi:hypothetical protein
VLLRHYLNHPEFIRRLKALSNFSHSSPSPGLEKGCAYPLRVVLYPHTRSPMTLITLLLYAFSLGLLSYAQPEPLQNYNSSDLLSTCNKISAAVSSASQVFFPRERVVFLICDTTISWVIKLHLSTHSTFDILLPRLSRSPLAQWSLALPRT